MYWRVRNDPLRSAVMGEIAKDFPTSERCGQCVGKECSTEYTRGMLAKAAALDILVDAIEPSNKYQIQSQVEKYLDNSLDAVAISADAVTPKTANTHIIKNQAEFLFIANLNLTCTAIIGKQI